MAQAKPIYAAAGAEENLELIVAPTVGHAMDVGVLLASFGQ
jgi:hypothetical protein